MIKLTTMMMTPMFNMMAMTLTINSKMIKTMTVLMTTLVMIMTMILHTLRFSFAKQSYCILFSIIREQTLFFYT